MSPKEEGVMVVWLVAFLLAVLLSMEGCAQFEEWTEGKCQYELHCHSKEVSK